MLIFSNLQRFKTSTYKKFIKNIFKIFPVNLLIFLLAKFNTFTTFINILQDWCYMTHYIGYTKMGDADKDQMASLEG